jgi:hypothetical protein
MSLLNKVVLFAKSPQGKRVIRQAASYAKSPQGREQLKRAAARAQAARNARRPPR